MRYSLLLLLVCQLCMAQISGRDKALLLGFSPEDKTYHEAPAELGFKNQNALLRYTFGGLLYIYQCSISVQISADCLYEHSCSRMSKSLFDHYAFHKALFCTADRLNRCDRLSAVDNSPYELNEQGKIIEDYTYYSFDDE